MILILGVTASGKGRLAFDLAESIGGHRLSSAERPEIISIDSMKVYKRMDIGTAKPPKQTRQSIKHHLIDIVEPSESFSVAAFLELADKAIEQIKSRNKPVIAVGGTALYIKALLFGLFKGPGTDEQIRAELKAIAEAEGPEKLYDRLTEIDPIAAQRISPSDAKRIIRALEVYKITGHPISSFQKQWEGNGRRMTDDRGQRTEDGEQMTDDGGRMTDDGRQKTDDGRQMTEDGRQMTEDGRQMTDDGRQMTEDGRRMTDDGRQRTEDGRQKTDDGRQTTEDRRQMTDDGRQKTDDRRQRTEDEEQMTDGRRRTRHEWTIIGLRREKSEENKKINARVKRMFEQGLVDEVESLLAEEKPLSPQAGCAIGYAEVIDYLNGRCDIEEAIELIKKNTRRFAKSQRTWFKTFPNVHWLDIEPEEPHEKILARAQELIADKG